MLGRVRTYIKITFGCTQSQKGAIDPWKTPNAREREQCSVAEGCVRWRAIMNGIIATQSTEASPWRTYCFY